MHVHHTPAREGVVVVISGEPDRLRMTMEITRLVDFLTIGTPTGCVEGA